MAGADRLAGVSYWLAFAFGLIGVALTVNQVFNLGLFGQPIIDTSFLLPDPRPVPLDRLSRLSGATRRSQRDSLV